MSQQLLAQIDLIVWMRRKTKFKSTANYKTLNALVALFRVGVRNLSTHLTTREMVPRCLKIGTPLYHSVDSSGCSNVYKLSHYNLAT